MVCAARRTRPLEVLGVRVDKLRGVDVANAKRVSKKVSRIARTSAWCGSARAVSTKSRALAENQGACLATTRPK